MRIVEPCAIIEWPTSKGEAWEILGLEEKEEELSLALKAPKGQLGQ